MVSVKLAALLALMPVCFAGQMKRYQEVPDLPKRTGDAQFGQGVSPVPTNAPRFVAAALHPRDAPFGTCGFFTRNGDPWGCEAPAGCSTSSGYFGCNPGLVLSTACRDMTHTDCQATRQGRGTLCCMSINWPFCITGFKTDNSGRTLTGFACANNILSGTQSLLITLPSSETTEIETETETTTITTPTNPNPRPTSPTSSPEPAAPTPIGAIVGGVVGGVAVIALIAFGVFWFCIRKRKTEEPPNNQFAPVAPTSAGTSPMPPVAQMHQYSPPLQSPAPSGSPTVLSPYSPLQSPPQSPPPPTYNPHYSYAAADGQYQPQPVPLQPGQPHQMQQYYDPKPNPQVASNRVSEVPAVNPSGMGNNAAELA